MEQRSFQVTGMTCGHCEAAVREEVNQIVGVDGVEVSAQTGKLTLTTNPSVQDGAVLAAVQEAGYEAERV